MPEPLTDRLARLIADTGPIPIADYMAQANAHYYATRDPLGTAGDFITAPEISQMFGELIGAWLVDLWQRSGRPQEGHYVELGPGRGTLAADALLAARSAGLVPTIELVETSPTLRARQAERLPQAHWHDDIESLPNAGPLLLVANEFFDALPARQYLSSEQGWRERLVAFERGGFVPIAGPPIESTAVPAPFRSAPAGTIFESSPASIAIVERLSDRIGRQGGVLLVIDYGHLRTGPGDTLQAVRSHGYADPWTDPGNSDLTVHVDFEALAHASKLACYGPVEQGAWLRAIGIDLRADALSRKFPDRAAEIAAARDRLVQDDQMGSLFKVMALVAPGWAAPAGFA